MASLNYSDETLSPAMRFLAALWRERSRAAKPADHDIWEGMRQALHLAIRLGLRFAPDDFAWMAGNDKENGQFSFLTWVEVDNNRNIGESLYRIAIAARNISAAIACETWKMRTPFFLAGKRLGIGTPFVWQGHQVFVTSFDDPRHALTACSYETVKRYDWQGLTLRGEGKIIKRFTLTHAVFMAAQRDKKDT